MRVLLDTNVVLDVLLARDPHLESSQMVLSLVDAGAIEGYVSASSVTTVYYLGRRVLGASGARRLVRELLASLSVASVDAGVLGEALGNGFADFEDAVIHEAAVAAGCDAVVTRDRGGFRRSSLPVLTPAECVSAVLAGR